MLSFCFPCVFLHGVRVRVFRVRVYMCMCVCVYFVYVCMCLPLCNFLGFANEKEEFL